LAAIVIVSTPAAALSFGQGTHDAAQKATVQGDQAAIESAQTQLAYSTITAPISGRTGVRLVDQGNIVHAGDANGLVVITQLQPISVMFSLSDRQLTNISREMANGPLKVIAEGRTDHQPLGEGTLALVDNQIDQNTGTIRLKATFPNGDHALWPGQFINVRLLLRTLSKSSPSPLQRSSAGQTSHQAGFDGRNAAGQHRANE
jgi:multidrug efflux system membrane fusion protein